MKRYLGIFILTIMVGLSGCASDTDSDTQVSSRAYYSWFIRLCI